MNNQHEPLTGILAGQLAPDFSLLNTNNTPVSLSDFTGRKTFYCYFPESLYQYLYQGALFRQGRFEPV